LRDHRRYSIKSNLERLLVLIDLNATIRKEYIKCSKPFCHRHKHGPYYYAYWKDPENKKLKKKYIGRHMPKNKEEESKNDNSAQ
jgi:hypothetical protein